MNLQYRNPYVVAGVKLTNEEKVRWTEFMHATWQAIAPDAGPLLPRGRNRRACIIEMCIDANRLTSFSDITREEERVLAFLWSTNDRKTMTWLREIMNYE